MLCLITCGLNGNPNVTHGYVFIHNLGTLKLSANIMNGFQERLNAGSMSAMALAFCGVVIVQRSLLGRCTISTENAS